MEQYSKKLKKGFRHIVYGEDVKHIISLSSLIYNPATTPVKFFSKEITSSIKYRSMRSEAYVAVSSTHAEIVAAIKYTNGPKHTTCASTRNRNSEKKRECSERGRKISVEGF